MQKAIVKITLILSILALICSCENDNPLYAENKINVTIKNSEQYEYRTNIAGDEEYAKIKTQAKHFEISKIIRDSSTGWIAVYSYKPKLNFIGYDSVEILTQRGSNGASPPSDNKIIKIIFKVTD